MRFYAVPPPAVGPADAWEGVARHAASLGFAALLLAPPGQPGPDGHLFRLGDPDAAHPALGGGRLLPAIEAVARQARAAGLDLWLDLVVDRAAAGGRLAATHPEWFDAAALAQLPDPRRPPPEPGVLPARVGDPAVAGALLGHWIPRLRALVAAGVAGFRCDAAHRLPPGWWRELGAAVPGARLLAFAPGGTAAPLAGAGFAAICDSLAWWDLRAGWYAEEALRLDAIAPVVALPEAPLGARLGARGEALARAVLRLAAGTGGGWILPLGAEYGVTRPTDPTGGQPGELARCRDSAACDLTDEVRAGNALLAATPPARELRVLAGPGGGVALLRAAGPDSRQAPAARLVLANPGAAPARRDWQGLLAGAGQGFGDVRPVLPGDGPGLAPGGSLVLAPGEARVLEARPSAAVRLAPPSAEQGAGAPRIGIEAVSPAVEDGRFAAKRLAGELVEVEADILCDGHDRLGAVLRWRAADAAEWQEARMRPLGNDRWAASFPLERLGRHVFAIEAWRDAFATFQDEIQKKHAAGRRIGLELEEGRLLVAAAAERGGGPLRGLSARLAEAPEAERLALLLAPETTALMHEADDRPFAARSRDYPVDADRTAARFASWYEMFPRSASDDVARHGTFRDVIAHLPRIRAMGFDVLYFTPIHPIGRIHRKGRNNTLTPAPDDPGSPYAIGAAEGGHDALHPELGTLDDFRALVAAARDHGLEIALDFAIQCSPDHPWLKQHPGWFAWRPDGSLRYAENPPKTYEDIVNVDFYAADAVPALWQALRDVVRFWVEQGVSTFRVDNPHTKPFPFWEWLIADIRAEHPEAIFLSEAFTRPKVMYRLAKLGFTQSYTYFTWRTGKRELTEYLTELTTTAPKDFFRPHFFVNTPDINPRYLQGASRAAYLVRAALAATLSGLWGVYNGFELCEGTPVPGKEEYLDSEKYQLRAWDWERPGNIVAEITRLNAIRRTNPALQDTQGLAFHAAGGEDLLWYLKATPDRSNALLIAVSLEPDRIVEQTVDVPLWEWGLPDHGALLAEDLMAGGESLWQGRTRRLRLDPRNGLPFGTWRVRPAEAA